jgi:hypothetical protein
MERHRLALLTALAVFAVPAAAQAAPVKISPKPAAVTADGATTIEVANPNRYALRGSATVTVGSAKVASRSVRLAKVSVTGVKLRFDAKRLAALRGTNGRATLKLALRRAGGKKATARRTLTLRLAGTSGSGAPAPSAPGGPGSGATPGPQPTSTPTPSNQWVGRMGEEGDYDDFQLTLIDGQITITEAPLVPVYCFENGAGHYGSAVSFEPFVVAGPWTLGSDGSVQQSGIAVNRLVSGGSRGITYKVTETAQSAGRVNGKLGTSFFDSKYDIFANQIWFVNCSGVQSFEAVPAP